MRKLGKILMLVTVAMLVFSVAAFAAPKKWVVGFSQIGSESEWRTANTISVQNAFLEDPSFDLIYPDAQQKQENQIKALRSFIARKVDAILFPALVETGYGPVLAEAKKAGIPVVMIDRDVAKRVNACWEAFAKADVTSKSLTCGDGFKWPAFTEAGDDAAQLGGVFTVVKSKTLPHGPPALSSGGIAPQ